MTREYKTDLQYRAFRAAVRSRDKHCQWPGCTSRVKLQIHHIQKWATAPHLRYEVQNGICLCKLHHSMIWSKEDLYAPLLYGIVKEKYKK